MLVAENVGHILPRLRVKQLGADLFNRLNCLHWNCARIYFEHQEITSCAIKSLHADAVSSLHTVQNKR
jgi:hypothetical protein